MCFRKDLAFGKKYEEIAMTYAEDHVEIIVDIPNGKCKEYDFKTNVFTYEVKADRMAYKYGCKSMFIEFECNNKDSGINSTKADYWFYFMVRPDSTYVAYRIPVALLKSKCLDSRIICGGDGGRVRGYVVMVDDLQEYKL
jgi:hypothetical protein